MPVELFFSNRLDRLADKLSHIVSEPPSEAKNIFSAPLIIVPNDNLEKWLKLHLAKKSGIAMNLDFQYLEDGLWRLLEKLDPSDETPEIINGEVRNLLLLAALCASQNDIAELEPVRSYLFALENQKTPDHSRRLWQLTEKLSGLFQEYEYHRMDMIGKWLRQSGRKEPLDAMEACQRYLYLSMKQIRHSLENDGQTPAKYRTLLEYFEQITKIREADLSDKKDRPGVQVFGFSHISVFHLHLIGFLAKHFDIFIHTLNPCGEYWEDVRTPFENRWIQRKSQKKLRIDDAEAEAGELFFPIQNPLLSLWGKPGREAIRLFCSLTDYDFNASFVPRENQDTVLSTIQNRILTLDAPDTTKNRLAQDTSLQIAACPSRLREVETVYNSILYNLEQDPELQLTDIAILVPDIDSHKPVIESVFTRSPRSITYNLVDVHARIESHFARAVLGLFELAAGRFSRKEVFELLLNPCVAEKWEITSDDIAVFAQWAEQLNIFHCFDMEDKKRKGYGENDLYTWKQGLTRLSLSRVLSDPEEFFESAANGSMESVSENLRVPAPHFQGKTPHGDFYSRDPERIEKFYSIVESLHRACQTLDKKHDTASQWARRLVRVIESMIEIPGELRAEKSVRESLLKSLEQLELFDQFGSTAGLSGMNRDLFGQYLNSTLGAIRGGHGDYLTGGVTISALLPMRPIPFSIVYILGMEEGAFPGKAQISSLDLRARRRRLGDVSLPERNCYLFLEVLLAARKKLYICYVCRDLQKDREIQPCSVVNQLRRYVESEILHEGKAFETCQIPLKGSSEKYIQTATSQAPHDLLVNYFLGDRVMYYVENNLWEEIKKMPSADDPQKIDSFLPDFTPASLSGAVDQPSGDDTIFIDQLKKFLENPVAQNVQKHLGVYDDSDTIEEIILDEDEPFHARFPTDYRLKMQPLEDWIDSRVLSGQKRVSQDELRYIFNTHYDRSQQESKTPEGTYADLDRRDIGSQTHRLAQTLIPVLEKILSTPNPGPWSIRLGQQPDYRSTPLPPQKRLQLPPLTLRVETQNISGAQTTINTQIHGGLDRLWRDDKNNLNALVICGSKKNAPAIPDKYLLRPVLFYLTLRASDHDPTNDLPFTVHVAYKNQVNQWTYRFEKTEAKQYLKTLLSEFLNPHQRAWLPFETVMQILKKPAPLLTPTPNPTLAQDFHDHLLETLTETDTPLIKLSHPKIPPNALCTAKQRFAIFFRHLETIANRRS